MQACSLCLLNNNQVPAVDLLLQTYLADGSCVDSVYRAILSRACAEPQRYAGILHQLLLKQEL